MPWVLPCIYSNILDQCLQYTITNYSYSGRIILVFDGYEDECSTKCQEHSNKSLKRLMAPSFHIHNVSMEVASQKNEFLRNTANKKQLIKLLSSKFWEAQIDVRESKGDADTLIAKTAKSCAEDGSIVVVSENTDVLVILLRHWNPDSGDIFFCCKRQETSRKAKTKHATKIQTVEVGVRRKKPILMWWSIRRIAEPRRDNFILFAHAFLGWDTTSAVYRKDLVSFQ